MILAAALSLALATGQEEPGDFHHGAWLGHCFRAGYLKGQDHEFCTMQNDGDKDPIKSVGVSIRRSAEEFEVGVWLVDCADWDKEDATPHSLAASAVVGPDRAATLAAFVRRVVTSVVAICKSQKKVPPIREKDIAALLRQTDGLQPGSIVPLDPAVRAPAAAKCGQQLEQAWRNGVKTNPSPQDGKVGLMMYTFSKLGPERADKRFAAAPEMMENSFAFGTGPGGAMISADKPAAPWRDPPSSWFVTTCDIAIEAWSSFVELAYYPSKDASEPLWGVRASTGVASAEGYMISQGRIVP
jgi:hypothetical protein